MGISSQLAAVGRTIESEFERLDRKIDVGFEQVRGDIRQLAELMAAQGERFERELQSFRAETRQEFSFLRQILGGHEQRISALEAPVPGRPARSPRKPLRK